MSGLAPGWASAKLGEIATTRLGKMLSASARAGINPRPYLRNKNVQWGRFELDDIAEMDFSEEEFARFEVAPGDLLVCEGGEVGRAAIWRGQIERVGYQKALHRVRPMAGIEPEFLLYLFMRLAQTNALEPFVTGSTIKHLPQEDLRELPVPLPPLDEQRRIVAAIEEQFSRLAAANKLMRAALLRISLLRRSVLVSVIPRPLPPHWKIPRVGDVGKVQLGRQRSPKYHVGANMKPYLRVANVFEDRLDLSDVMQMHFSPVEAERYRLHPGDILLNEGQSPELVGRAAMFRGEMAEICFTNSLIRFQPGPDVDGEFALLVFRSHLHSGRFQREARITTNIAHMASGRFKTVEFPLPPLKEQLALRTEAHRRLSLVDALESDVKMAVRRGNALRRSILERAFSGELVPQDPIDEPAFVLLERIATERAAVDPRKRRKVPA
jgi:type I restriction enzyme, S subunit